MFWDNLESGVFQEMWHILKKPIKKFITDRETMIYTIANCHWKLKS